MIFSNFFQMFLEFILGVQRYFWNPQKVFCAQNIFLTRFRALTYKKIFHSKLEFREPPPIVNTVIDVPSRGRGSRHDRNRIQKMCSQVIFYISKHPKTLSKFFGTFRGRQGTFKSHFHNFLKNYDFLCIFPYTTTQGLHRNYTGIWVQADKNTFFEQILIPTSPKSSLQYQKTFVFPRTTLGKSKTMIGTI